MNIIEKKIENNILLDDNDTTVNVNDNNTIEKNEIIDISINENTDKKTKDTYFELSNFLKRGHTNFPCPKSDNSDASEIYNGSFQYTTSRDRSWIHTDKWNNWAGVLFMTPNAPLSAGTAFYRFKDGAMCEEDGKILNNIDEVDRFSQDLTKWEMVDSVGNVFNRLVLFNAHRYHMSMDYFGDTKENARLFQTFFFSTER